MPESNPIFSSNLGFPRIGPNRELKKSLEAFWSGKISEESLRATAADIRKANWLLQKGRGIDHIPSNDFSLYDHVLDTIAMVGAVPPRFGPPQPIDLPTYFAIARGVPGVAALELTKWFDTNYHYLVPEFEPNPSFRVASTKAVDEFKEAKALGVHTRPVLLGPVSFLLLGKTKRPNIRSLDFIDDLVPVYEQILKELSDAGADWVQIDEPCLVLDLDPAAHVALARAYGRLAKQRLDILLATYFGDLADNLDIALNLPIAALHVDLVRAPRQLDRIVAKRPPGLSLSLGLVDGRNIWNTDLSAALDQVEKAAAALGPSRVMVGPSCSLLHVPVDLDSELDLGLQLKSWLAFANQKLDLMATLTKGANKGRAAIAEILDQNARIMADRRSSSRIHNASVAARADSPAPDLLRRRSPFPVRKIAQQRRFALPDFPTTTIGSFPQTPEIRAARAANKSNRLSNADYTEFLQSQIRQAIQFQDEIGIDVPVHGEFERNDMVEYFGEQLDGVAVSANGWVQSYGSRCVKPPIIFGDVRRPAPMTVQWSAYAKSLTSKPIKGMLTGPVTILQWSFVRDDQPRERTCRQIALAIRDEVADLESAGIGMIQIDEPALREGLPLRKADWPAYLRWSVDAFRLASAVVRDDTQIHTHMCYCEFNDIIESIAQLDADVISIETSRSGMELLAAFARYRYPNDIGPGVYDIHSPRIPTVDEMIELLARALAVLDPGQIWVNPDCGLKTRQWDQVKPALANMVQAVRVLRSQSAARDSSRIVGSAK